jgi:ABC-type sugar transport system ATPase subunit
MTDGGGLRVEGLTKSFGEVRALVDCSLTARGGEILGIVGDNGAGKSTFIRSVAGLHRPDSGAVSVDGQTLSEWSPPEAWRLGIGTVFQDLALAPDIRVADNVFMGREIRKWRRLGPLAVMDRATMRVQTEAALGELGIALNATARASELSGGQRQAVAVARMLIAARRVVLLDEPTAALSVAHRGMVEQCMRRLAEAGSAVVVVSHNFPELVELADRIAVFRHGRVVATRRRGATTPDELVGLVTGALGPGDVDG